MDEAADAQSPAEPSGDRTRHLEATTLVAKHLSITKHYAVVAKLINFIRSPWVTLEYGHAFASEGRETKFSKAQRQTFRSDRKALLEYRKVLLDGSTKAFDLYYKDSEMQKKAFEVNRELMRQRLKGHKEICGRLIPDFEVGCRRYVCTLYKKCVGEF